MALPDRLSARSLSGKRKNRAAGWRPAARFLCLPSRNLAESRPPDLKNRSGSISGRRTRDRVSCESRFNQQRFSAPQGHRAFWGFPHMPCGFIISKILERHALGRANKLVGKPGRTFCVFHVFRELPDAQFKILYLVSPFVEPHPGLHDFHPTAHGGGWH